MTVHMDLFKMFFLKTPTRRLSWASTTTFLKRNEVYRNRSNCQTREPAFSIPTIGNVINMYSSECRKLHVSRLQSKLCVLNFNMPFHKYTQVLQHFYRNKHRQSKTRDTVTVSSNQEETDSSDEESTEDLDTYEDLAGAPNNFSVVKVHSKALRSDGIASLGLNIARNKMDELFYNSKMRLNGEKLLKKSHQMEVGDYVDVITDTREEQVTVKRVQVLKVGLERTRSDKLSVWLRVWKQGFKIDKQDGDV